MRLFLAALVAAFFMSSARAAETPWSIGGLYGFSVDESVDEFPGPSSDARLMRSYIIGLNVGREVWRIADSLALEVEGQVIQHSGVQSHFEFISAIGLRWHAFPWDEYLDTSFAVFEGLSLASQKPQGEITRHGDTARLLNYVGIEFDFSLPDDGWSLVARLHHRSGVWGTFSGIRAGSNFFSIGLRRRF